MPIYDFKCPNGHIERDRYARPDESPICECGSPMEHYWGETDLMFASPFGGYDKPGYKCPVTDQWVDSKQKRRNIMAEYGLIEVGGSDERKSFAERRREHNGKPPGGAGSRNL